MRGTNRYLPEDIAVNGHELEPDFHARFGARGRKYAFLVRESAVRPAIEAGMCGWVFRPLDLDTMRERRRRWSASTTSARLLIGVPGAVARQGDAPHRHRAHRRLLALRFEANAFLHHMVRNLMGALIAIGNGSQPPETMARLLAERDRALAPPTFPAAGLYFLGPQYDPHLAVPRRTAAHDWLPRVPPELARPDETRPLVSGPAPKQ